MRFDYFGTVTEYAYKDPAGVYKDGKKVALDNTIMNGYFYYSGNIKYDLISKCAGEYNTTSDFIFIGAAPGCSEDDVYLGLMERAGCDDFIYSISFDKAKAGIDVSKFDGVTVVIMKFRQKVMEVFDETLDCPIC